MCSVISHAREGSGEGGAVAVRLNCEASETKKKKFSEARRHPHRAAQWQKGVVGIWRNRFAVLRAHMPDSAQGWRAWGLLGGWAASHQRRSPDGKQQQIGHSMLDQRDSAHVVVFARGWFARWRVHGATSHPPNGRRTLTFFHAVRFTSQFLASQGLEYLSNQALCGSSAVQQRLWMPALTGASVTHRPLQMYSATWLPLIDPNRWFAAAWIFVAKDRPAKATPLTGVVSTFD
jgi:hypothetical protein